MTGDVGDAAVICREVAGWPGPSGASVAPLVSRSEGESQRGRGRIRPVVGCGQSESGMLPVVAEASGTWSRYVPETHHLE